MPKTLSSKISDPRPRINVALSSDDDKTTAEIVKGYVNVQRGHHKAVLRVPYGEVRGVIDLLEAAAGILEDNQYDPAAGSDIPSAASPEDATDAAVSTPGNAADADVHTAATEGEGSPEAAATPTSSDSGTSESSSTDPAGDDRSDADRAAAVDARNTNPFAA